MFQAACLNETQLFTMDKFLKGIFVKKEKKGVKDLGRSDPADGDVTVKSEDQEEKGKSVGCHQGHIHLVLSRSHSPHVIKISFIVCHQDHIPLV